MEKRFEYQDKPLGSGGFGRVFPGKDNVLQRKVAVKILKPALDDGKAEFQERFRREARILAKLSHPHIPAIFDANFREDDFFIIFEFIEGKNLAKLLQEEGACSLAETIVWFKQVASALDHAHENHVVHRDVKPDNIIITPDRSAAYLVDFGIALTAEEINKLTRVGYAVGTEGYIAPEQLEGGEADARADLYSLGVTLYEALAGRALPRGEYSHLSEANPAIPSEVDDLIVDCIAPKEKRITSAKDFLARLSGTISSTKTLTEVLAHGRLIDLDIALQEMNAATFAKLPEGQRALILARVADIIESEDPHLDRPAKRFLELLVERAVLLPRGDYEEVIIPALRWGFEKDFGGFAGAPRLREALQRAAEVASGEAYEVLADSFLHAANDVDLRVKEDWYLGGMRLLLNSLLANPACGSRAKPLVAKLKEVNRAGRSKPTH